MTYILDSFDKDTCNKIFVSLDKNQSGKIKVDDFLDNLTDNLQKQTNFQPFYNYMQNELEGKLEKIIIKLKKIRQKLCKYPESIDDINW